MVELKTTPPAMNLKINIGDNICTYWPAVTQLLPKIILKKSGANKIRNRRAGIPIRTNNLTTYRKADEKFLYSSYSLEACSKNILDMFILIRFKGIINIRKANAY